MVRVTAVDLITSALAGGAVLGAEFSRFVRVETSQSSFQTQENI